MRHARPDYDRIQDPAGLIPDDEPVFLVRGQDICALAALGAWIDEAIAYGAPANIVAAAREHYSAIADWQAVHSAKVPDMPRTP